MMKWIQEHELLPLSHYKTMRSESPLLWAESSLLRSESPQLLGGTFWHAYRYDHIKSIFADNDHFSSELRSEDKRPIEYSILRIDPPKHSQLRTLVSQAFTPRSIEKMIPRIEALANELLDKVERNGQMDAVQDFAVPLPIIVIAEILGIPVNDRDQFREWSEALVSGEIDRNTNCQKEMAVYFETIAEERRRNPQDDLITRLVHATSDGEPLSPFELIGFCILLLVAGNETTTNLLSSALVCFDRERSAWNDIRSDRSLLPGAIEEVLRFASPVQLMIRRVKKDVEVDGMMLTEGQFVMLWIGSANHDESVFEQPDLFHIGRHPNPHIAFGHGIHFCLGAQLARLEARIALNAMLDRFPNYQCDHSKPLKRIQSEFMFGIESLPIILT